MSSTGWRTLAHDTSMPAASRPSSNSSLLRRGGVDVGHPFGIDHQRARRGAPKRPGAARRRERRTPCWRRTTRRRSGRSTDRGSGARSGVMLQRTEGVLVPLCRPSSAVCGLISRAKATSMDSPMANAIPPSMPNTSTEATVMVPSQSSDRLTRHRARKSRTSNRPRPATITMPDSTASGSCSNSPVRNSNVASTSAEQISPTRLVLPPASCACRRTRFVPPLTGKPWNSPDATFDVPMAKKLLVGVERVPARRRQRACGEGNCRGTPGVRCRAWASSRVN